LPHTHIYAVPGFIWILYFLGFIHDPDELPGLVHFLEHMLFMGSKKYPEENYFLKFVDEHAGLHNGETGEREQNYFWDISSDYLAELLDM